MILGETSRTRPFPWVVGAEVHHARFRVYGFLTQKSFGINTHTCDISSTPRRGRPLATHLSRPRVAGFGNQGLNGILAGDLKIIHRNSPSSVQRNA
jgi:hypothetical protein